MLRPVKKKTRNTRIRKKAIALLTVLFLLCFIWGDAFKVSASGEAESSSEYDYGEYESDFGDFDFDSESFDDLEYLLDPYGGFGPDAEVEYDDDENPVSVNGYPVRNVTTTFSNFGELTMLDMYFVDYPFWQSPEIYDGNLAVMSLTMSFTANRNFPEEDNSDTNFDTGEELERALKEAGFTDIKKYDYGTVTSFNTIGTAIGHRTMEHEGEEPFTLISVGLCGCHYVNEWQSNINIGDGDIHEGFAYSSDQVLNRLAEYMEACNITGRTKIWMYGVSRAAAVINLSAARLSDRGVFAKEDIYAYTFASPTISRQASKEGYEYIHNIIDPADIIPQFPPEEWGFKRYGQDYYLKVEEFTSMYGAMVTGMRNEMNENEFNVQANYSPELNFRVRTMLSMMIDATGNQDHFVKLYYPSIIGCMEDSSLSNILKEVRSFGIRERSLSAKERARWNESVDFTLNSFMGIVRRKGYNKADNNAGKLQVRFLIEHSQNSYLANMVTIRGGDFADTESFYYVMVRGPVKVNVSWMDGDFGGPFLTVNADGTQTVSEEGKEILGEGMTEILAESVYAERCKNTTVVAIPLDRDVYRIDWEAESKGKVECLQVRCERNTSATFEGARSEAVRVAKGDTGTAFWNPDNDSILPFELKEVTVSAHDVARFMGMETPAMNWKMMLMIFTALISLPLCILACLILRHTLRQKYPFPVWALTGLLVIALNESELGYWLFADTPFIRIGWLLFAAVTLLALYLKTRHKELPFKEQFRLKRVVVGAVLLIPALSFIFIYLLISHSPLMHFIAWIIFMTGLLLFALKPPKKAE